MNKHIYIYERKENVHTHLNNNCYFGAQTLNWFQMLNHHGPGIAGEIIAFNKL